MCDGPSAEGTVPAAKEPRPEANTRSAPGCMTRFMMSPFRGLRRIRDMYVNSLGNCTTGGAARGGRKSPTDGGLMVATIMPRVRSRSAFGHNSYRSGPDGRDDDFRELVRVNSKQVDAAVSLQSTTTARPRAAVTVVPRSQSVAAAIGRIDEDCPCEFDVDRDDVNKLAGIPTGPAGAAYSRSRSCAVVPTERSSTAIAGFNLKAG